MDFERVKENLKGPMVPMITPLKENFELDDDLMEWKAYLRLKEDRKNRLEDIQHERFQVA